MIRTPLPYGAYPTGGPDFDWLYRTPAFPDGVSQLQLQNLDRQEQDGLAEYWFRLNFVPFQGDLGGAGYGISSASAGGYASGTMLPGTYLNDEFAEVLPSSVIENVSVRLQREATWWIPATPEPSLSNSTDLAGTARVALERVEADLERVDADFKRVGPGHNQGPPLDPAIVAEAVALVLAGREALEAGPKGLEKARLVQVGLLAIASAVVLPFFKKLSEHAADDTYPHLKHSLATAADHMLQAAAALGHWAATLPPPAL